MGLNPRLLPPNIIALIGAPDREQLGIITPEMAVKKWSAGEEKKLQDLVRNYVSLNRFAAFGSRMDKRTTRKKGEPDFLLCVSGRFIAVECKAGVNMPTEEQQAQLNLISDNGGVVCIARSLDDVRAVVRLAQKHAI